MFSLCNGTFITYFKLYVQKFSIDLNFLVEISCVIANFKIDSFLLQL